MLWLKAFHIITMVAWFAALFYLPRLFVYHAMAPADDHTGHERLCTQERRLYRGIMTPGAVLTMLTGIALMAGHGAVVWTWGWLHAKLALIGVLLVYHAWCGVLVHRFARAENRHGHAWYRWFNEVPTVLLIAIVILAVVRPF